MRKPSGSWPRKRTKDTLRESEARYRLLLESSPDPVVVYDVQGAALQCEPGLRTDLQG